MINTSESSVFIQIKSRGTGEFSKGEISNISAEVADKVNRIKLENPVVQAICLEQTFGGGQGEDLADLFDGTSGGVYVCNNPDLEIIAILIDKLDCADSTAEIIADSIYRLVASSAAANASLSYEERRRITTTEIEGKIFDLRKATELSSITDALRTGSLEPIDFTTPVDDNSFYLGVKTKPGHIAAGLVLDRPDETKTISEAILAKRHVLIEGPSGAGKSALLWLSARALDSQMRWFRTGILATASDAEAILTFVRGRRPHKNSPIGIAVDEVGELNADLWNILVSELRGLPNVHLLGSIRREDKALVIEQAEVAFFSPLLSETFAEQVWNELRKRSLSDWSHWREPFELSDGLMLEYVHLLTKGQRLADVISDQVSQRQREGRNDELAIIRATSVLGVHGGEVDASRLFSQIGLTDDKASLALRRLIDEHLVQESRPGILGGLHYLRSKALADAAHDNIVHSQDASFWLAFNATTPETLPNVVQASLSPDQGFAESEVLDKLAENLTSNSDAQIWTATLTGLGLATLERHTETILALLTSHDVPRSQWTLAFMFVSAGMEFPDLPGLENITGFRSVLSKAKSLHQNDLRLACLSRIPDGVHPPDCNNLTQASNFIACLAPLAGGEPLITNFTPDIEPHGKYSIDEVAALLSTSYALSPSTAAKLAEAFGGEKILLEWFGEQKPWVDRPTFFDDPTNGRTVRSNWFQVAEGHQPDAHASVVEICQTLISICPSARAVASDAVNPAGEVIEINGFAPASKNMPRANLPAKTSVAWNVAFRQLLLARSAEGTLTNYAEKMTKLTVRTEKAFRSFTEKWIRGKNGQVTDKQVADIQSIIEEVNSLSYFRAKKPKGIMSNPAESAGESDTLGALLVGILGNLLQRLTKIATEGSDKSLAGFTGDLYEQSQEHIDSDIWRTASNPPIKSLIKIRGRLKDLADITQELSEDKSPEKIASVLKSAKSGNLQKGVSAAARMCNKEASARLSSILTQVEQGLAAKGWSAVCKTKEVPDLKSHRWPRVEVAVIIEITDFEGDAHCFDDGFDISRDHLGDQWKFCVVPKMKGRIVGTMAMHESLDMILPHTDFETEWKNSLDMPFAPTVISDAFTNATTACINLSAIIHSRNIDNLHPEEQSVFDRNLELFEQNKDAVFSASKEKHGELYKDAVALLEDMWGRVADELKEISEGERSENPLCMDAHNAIAGSDSPENDLVSAAIIMLRQEEALAEL